MSIEAAIAHALLDPALPPPAGLHAPGGASIARRFAVHRNTFVAGRIDSLASCFPVVEQLVGTDFFRSMARAYVLKSPPASARPHDHVQGFAGFVGNFAPAAAVTYLADVARLEALVVHAAHAVDQIPMDRSVLAALSADPQRLWRARVRLHPATGWLQSCHAVSALWQAHQPGGGAVAALAGVDLDQSETVVVYRPQLAVRMRRLPTATAGLLDALRAGWTIGEVLADAARIVPAPDLKDTLQLLADGSVVALVDREESHAA